MNVVTFKSDWPQVWSEMRERVRHRTSYHIHLWLLGGVLLVIAAAANITPISIDITRVVLTVSSLTGLVFLVCRSVAIYFHTPRTREEWQKKLLLDLDCSIVSKFEKNFESDNLDEAEIILIGERHHTGCSKIEVDIIDRFKTSDPKQNVVLMEGTDKTAPHELDDWAQWGGWDNGEAFQYIADMLNKIIPGKMGDATWLEKRKIRNESLVATVREQMSHAKIFVLAGINHIPTTLLETFKEKKVLFLHLTPPTTQEGRKKHLQNIRSYSKPRPTPSK